MGFGVWCLGCGVRGHGFGVTGFWVSVEVLGFRVWSFGFWVLQLDFGGGG